MQPQQVKKYLVELFYYFCRSHANKRSDVIFELIRKPRASWKIELVDAVQVLCHTFHLVQRGIYELLTVEVSIGTARKGLKAKI